MPETKYYVYSARTTEKGLALLNKTKGDKKSWDTFINEVVAAHYGLDLNTITLLLSKYLVEREEKRKAKETEKAKKATEKKTKANQKKVAKKTTSVVKENGKK